MSQRCRFVIVHAFALIMMVAQGAIADVPIESVWIEAESFQTIRGYCWPQGRPGMVETDGHWGLSGPGWATEWTQGGESGFLSIAAGPGDAAATVSTTVDVPITGDYTLWVRYADWREAQERFEVSIQQNDAAEAVRLFGDAPAVEEDNEAKLYWGWAFGWRAQPVTLLAGSATVTLRSAYADDRARQVDCMVLTTDRSFRPLIKDRPANHAWAYLDTLRQGIAGDIAPLARQRMATNPPQKWKPRTFNDKGFKYLWNVSHVSPRETWLSDDPKRVLYPHNFVDDATKKAFAEKYGGRTDVPIFSDPRIVPTFHSVGPEVFQVDSPTEAVADEAKRFIAWLDADPNRLWATMMNYHPDTQLTPGAWDPFVKYRDRYIGSIAGENTGYFEAYLTELKEAAAGATTRRELATIISEHAIKANAQKYRNVLGRDLDDAYREVISCLSVGNIAFMPLCADWGARTIGYESTVATSTILNMRWAFMRGCARQWGNLTASYRSCNFGDSATLFSTTMSYTKPQNILDNFYSVYSGAGMTWYKFDIWYQYMAGSSMFYHEQGFDEYWMPGGTSAAGQKEIQLSPKGKLVDRFLRLTAADKHFDRGTPITPAAFLVDYAHGWEPAPYWPNSFKNFHKNEEAFLFGDHERALHEMFFAAWHPIGPLSQKPMTALNETNLPGVFGDVFDVIFAYPDTDRWTTIDTYPVVIVAGDIDITEAEGKRLAQYVNDGGTLLIADAQLTGPGAAHVGLLPMGETAQASGYHWMGDEPIHASQRYHYRPIIGGKSLATTPDGKTFCAYIDRGEGRLIMLSIPRGLGIDRRITPVVPRLLAHLTAGQMPIRVDGDVQWMVNRTDDGRWMVTLINPFGQDKPQQGITPTDYRANRRVTLHAASPIISAVDRLLPTDPIAVDSNSTIDVTVAAGSLRIIEIIPAK